MAETNNFYEWLELPLEYFEGDPAKLTAAVDQHILTWNSSKAAQLQNRAALYETDIRAAIADPTRWKRIYEDFRKSTDQRVLRDIEMMSRGSSVLLTVGVKKIAQLRNVSEAYVEQLAKSVGKEIGDAVTKTASPNRFSLKSMEPPSDIRNSLEVIQRSIQELSFKTVADLINSQLNSGNISLQNSRKDKVTQALEEIKKKWSRVPASGAKHQQKAHFDKICSGMLQFLKKHDLSDYLNYLQWKRVSEILTQTFRDVTSLGVDTLSDKIYNDTADSVYEVIGNREHAVSVLETYCDEKKIGYPRTLPNVAVCPFCHTSFEKSTPFQTNCPVCAKSFLVKCPKCGTQHNFLSEPSCGGVDLRRYPFLLKRVKAARDDYGRLSLSMAESILDDVEKEWPDFPEVANLKQKCADARKKYEPDLKKIDRLLQERRYNEARTVCDRILREFPNSREAYRTIYAELETARQLWSAYQAETDQRKKLGLLLELLTIVADDAQANAELLKYPVQPVKNLSARINHDAQLISLNWDSDNRDNSVYYIIRRKAGTPVSSPSDGEEIARTQGKAYGDVNAQEGQAYYYAVYASRGSLNSPLCGAGPVIFLKDLEMSVASRDGAIEVSWAPLPSGVFVKASYSAAPVMKLEHGTPCPNVTPTGFTLEGLPNGLPCYLYALKYVTFEGKEYASNLCSAVSTPVRAISFPVVSKSLGDAAGEYLLTHDNPQPGLPIHFYYSELPGAVQPNSNVSMNQVNAKLKKLVCVPKGENRFLSRLASGKDAYVYPLYIRDNMATIGGLLVLKHIKPMRIIGNPVVSGNRLSLRVDEWPQGSDAVYLCFNDDAYPEDRTDCDGHHVIFANEYRSKELLELPGLREQAYYITVFARQGGDYIPICNCFFDNRKRTRLEYSFSVNWHGGVSARLRNPGGTRPELSFVVLQGRMPLDKSDGTLIRTIPAEPVAPALETISIKGYKAQKNSYARFFTDDASFRLILNGTGKLLN